jgi:hypothetical protein
MFSKGKSMVYIKVGNEFADDELGNLSDFLALLDAKLEEIQSQINESPCPDSEGIFDKGEYFIGLGFSAIQKYITSIHGQDDVPKSNALNLGKKHSEGTTIISVINAAANYWKHQDEWGLKNLVSKDTSNLNDAAKKTIAKIEEVTPWDDYTCSNVIAALTSVGNIKLSPLIPTLIDWRSEIDKMPSVVTLN